jgi:hypothetical protein
MVGSTILRSGGRGKGRQAVPRFSVRGTLRFAPATHTHKNKVGSPLAAPRRLLIGGLIGLGLLPQVFGE